MKSYIHATISSTLAWAGNIYDLLIVTYIYPYLEKAYSLNFAGVTLLFALGLIGRVVGGTIFGKLSDRVLGRKEVLLIGTAGYSIFGLLLPFSPSSIFLFIFRLLEGVFMGAQWTAGTVLAFEQAPLNMKSFVVSIVQAGYGIGYALTAVAYITFLPIMQGDGWRFFLATSVFPLAIVPYAYVKLKEAKEASIISNTEKPKLKDYFSITLKASIAMAGMFIAYFVLFENYPTIAERWAGMPASELGLTLLIANIVLTIMFIVFGRLAEIFGKRLLILLSVILLLVFVPLSVPPIKALANPTLMMIGTIGYAMFCGYWPLMPTLLVEAVPREVRGVISGLSYNIGGLVGGIASVLVGIISTIQTLHLWVDALSIFSLTVIFITMLTWPKSSVVQGK
ncbi:MAG: MFS transporter [Sulfolobaceae archaeon]|nr:MFS transporter [Sulfolobaceae archaeon]